MKRIVSVILLLGLLLIMAACENKQPIAAPLPSAEVVPSETTVLPTEATEATTQTEVAPPEHPFFDLEFTNAYTYKDDSGVVRGLAIAQVINTSDISYELSLCSLELADSNGKPVYSSKDVAAYPPIIAPGEAAYYFEEFEPDTAYIGELEFSISIPDPTEAESVRYDVVQDKLPMSGALPFLYEAGIVKNPTDKTGDFVCVAMVLFDKNKAPLAVAYTYLMEPLAVGGSSEFVIENYLLPDELETALYNFEFFAFPIN